MSSRRVAALFPGQGAYFRGALTSLTTTYPQVQQVFGDIDAAAEDLLGAPVSPRLLHGPGTDVDTLVRQAPADLQLAIYGTSVAVHEIVRSHGLQPDLLVGHSLGEIAALASAGAWTIRQGAEIVCHRSLALASHAEPGAGMVALGMDPESSEALVRLVGRRAVVSVENHARQTVVTAPNDVLDTIASVAHALRVQCTRLQSPYPFHSPHVTQASAAFAVALSGRYPSAALQVPVYSPIEGRFYTDVDDLEHLIATHLVRRVRFGAAIDRLSSEGAEVFVECGALGGLTGIVGKLLDARPHVAVAPLRPDPSESVSLASSLAELARHGVVLHEDSGAATAHRVLLAEVDHETFATFWAARGADVVAHARSALGQWQQLRNATGLQEPQPDGAEAGSSDSGRPGSATVEPVEAGPGALVGEGGAVLSRERVLQDVVQLYATALEYPPEVLEEDTDLESELGVDSVKQTELLARVSENFGLPPRPDDFRAADYSTIGRVADLVMGRAESALAPPAAPAATPVEAGPGALVGEGGAVLSRERVLQDVVQLYATALEYPPEVLEEDTDLESELGVDSVKQTELLARVSENFGLPPRPDDFRAADYSTIGRVADLVVGGVR